MEGFICLTLLEAGTPQANLQLMQLLFNFAHFSEDLFLQGIVAEL